MTPPTTWPFPRWVLRRGKWVMVRTKPAPRPAYPVGAEPAPF
jgi:hypothetical protein